MDYLARLLGVSVVYQEDEMKSMPNFIRSRYTLKKVKLDDVNVIFVHPKNDLDSIDAVKKHLERIKRIEDVPVVLTLDHLTYRQKEYLIRDHIPFIVEGKQVYLPFLAVYLQERGDGEKQDTEKILPSAQLLLLHFIYCGCKEMMTSEATQYLGFTPTSISRASRQLQEMGLVRMEKRGVQKVILSDKTPEELFNAAQKKMVNPVKKALFVPKTLVDEGMLLSGYSALSEFTMINPPLIECFAANSISHLEKNATSRLQNSVDQCKIELWRYDPRKLTSGVAVDRLSLVLSLREDKDERIEECLEEMLKEVWEEING